MIELRISPTNKQHLILKEKLDQMSLARKIIEIDKAAVPSLKEGKQLHQGITAIQKALDELKTFQTEWYACTCDKYDWL